MSNYTDQTTSSPILNFYSSASQLTSQPNPSGTQLHMIPAGGVSLPSGRYIDFTAPAHYGSYSAPADGWIVFEKTSSNSDQYMRLTNSSNSAKNAVSYARATASSQMLGVTIPVCSGDSVLFQYTTGGSTDTCRFVYANGTPNVSAS